MTQQHPDLAARAGVHRSRVRVPGERAALTAWKLRDLTEADRLGGTFQARYERDVFDEALVNRLDRSSISATPRSSSAASTGARGRARRGRVLPHRPPRGGRRATASPVVIDWRAPVAEPFYRATGREPMGLLRRRHFAVEGRKLLGIEDELFGEGHLGIGHDEGLDGSAGAGCHVDDGCGATARCSRRSSAAARASCGDIVATIQGEQDEIIRSPQAGVLVVQGGPGTGKTVVALHRAAYLLYTYRFPLEDQGVLVIGPNRVFLRYIEQRAPLARRGRRRAGRPGRSRPRRGVRWPATDARRAR